MNVPKDVTDSALRRVRKMLALANDGGATEGERNNALRMAYATLAKHNLTLGDVAEQTAPEEARVQEDTINQADLWASKVSLAVAELFFCKYFVYSKRVGAHKKKHAFIGRKSNVQTAISMADWLIKSIEKESGIEMRARGELYPWRRSFCLGAADKIRERAREMRKEATVEPGKGLVLLSLYQKEMTLNQAMLSGMRFGKVNRGRSAGAEAYRNGQDYGSKMNLSRQVRGPVQSQMLRIGRSA